MLGAMASCTRNLWFVGKCEFECARRCPVPVNHRGCLVCPLSDLSPSSFITLGATTSRIHLGTRHIQTPDCDIQNRGPSVPPVVGLYSPGHQSLSSEHHPPFAAVPVSMHGRRKDRHFFTQCCQDTKHRLALFKFHDQSSHCPPNNVYK